MAINLKGKSNKELHELRVKLTADAKAHYESNEENWTSEHQAKHDEMIADLGLVADLLKRRDTLGETTKGKGAGCVIEDNDGHKHRLFGAGDSFTAAYGQEKVPNVLGHWICAKASPNYTVDGDLRREFAALDTTSGAAVMPSETYAGMIDYARNTSRVLQAGAQVLDMSTNEVRLGRRENTVAPQVKQEGELFTSQEMKFGYVLLRSFFIGSYYELSREWIDDSANAAAEVENMIRADLAVGVDNFALNGSGSQQPEGLMTMAGISTATGGSVSWSDFATAATAIRGGNYEPNACILSNTIYDTVRDSKDSQNRWLEAPPSLRNVNFLPTNQAATTDAVIGDFTKMIWGVRQGVTVEATNYGGEAHKRHMTYIKVYWRGDFGVQYPGAFRKFTDLSVS